MAFFATGGVVMAWMATVWWVFELATHFRWQVGLVFLICGLSFVLSKHWKQATFCLAMVVYHLWLLAPAWIASSTNPSSQPIIKGLLANVEGDNHNHQGLLQLIKKEKPDVVVLLEIRPHWERALAPLKKHYPHMVVRARQDNFGLAFMSRLPVQSIRWPVLGKDRLPTVHAQLRVKKQLVSILGVHLVPPISRDAAYYRNERSHRTARYTRMLGEPAMIWGDLNISPWSPYFHNMLRQGQLKDSRNGKGLQLSWPTMFPILLTPLDHILHTSGIRIVKRTVGPSIGSDHYPILVQFQLQATPTKPSR